MAYEVARVYRQDGEKWREQSRRKTRCCIHTWIKRERERERVCVCVCEQLTWVDGTVVIRQSQINDAETSVDTSDDGEAFTCPPAVDFVAV